VFVTGEVKIGEVRSAKQARRGYASARTLQTNYYGGFYVHGFIYNALFQRRRSDRSRGRQSRKSGGRGDAEARRVNPLTEAERSPSQHLGERKVESTPRPERDPGQHLGERKVESAPRPERNPS